MCSREDDPTQHLEDQPPVPGGTTAIRGGKYVTEERAPGPPSPLWLPYFEQHEVTTMGEEWPSYIVTKWERNQIGETRFTGQSRLYTPREAT